MTVTDFLGFLAASLTTTSFVPQVLKTFTTRDTSSISLLMYALFVFGVGTWLIWGLALRQWPVVAANGVTLALAATVLAYKIYDLVTDTDKEKP